MAISGIEIFRTRDEHGGIRVFDDGQRRTLSFGTNVEQSAVFVANPETLVYSYTQAMMLGLLFCGEAPRITALGLGGGSIVTALLHHLPGCRIDAVEQRASVVELAHRFFLLPRDPRLTIHTQNAEDYLKSSPRPSELLFTDIYHANGMDSAQASHAFLRNCREALLDDGVVVINLWHESFAETLAVQTALLDIFDERVLQTMVPGGNSIAIGFKTHIPRLPRRKFLDTAQALGLRMQIPLQRLARNLWNQNVERLR